MPTKEQVFKRLSKKARKGMRGWSSEEMSSFMESHGVKSVVGTKDLRSAFKELPRTSLQVSVALTMSHKCRKYATHLQSPMTFPHRSAPT